jgi:hypothetical protein
MLGEVVEILGLLWFLPFYDYLNREKEILTRIPSRERKNDLVRKAAYYVQHHVTDLKTILC